jgi:hypothetical protein
MVSLSSLNLGLVRKAILDASADDATQPDHFRAFASWILANQQSSIDLLIQFAANAAKVSGPERQSQHAAILGYGLQTTGFHREEFSSAVDWLSKRNYFVADRPPGFECDGISILGVAVGLCALADSESGRWKQWLSSLAARTLSDYDHDEWTKGLISAALALVGDPSFLKSKIFEVADLDVALAAKGLIQSGRDMEEKAWLLVSSLEALKDGFTRAACGLLAFDSILLHTTALRFDGLSVDDVARILNGVQRSMRLWTWDDKPRTPKSVAARWEIENEYHVQNLVWAVLAPLFPDLDDEEWLKSLGHHHPRGDFAIPSLELIVEVKFARDGGKSIFSKLIEEIAADASTYLQSGSGYKHIIVFLWDDLARTEEHSEFKQGVKRLTGVADAIVISRPRKMARA